MWHSNIAFNPFNLFSLTLFYCYSKDHVKFFFYCYLRDDCYWKLDQVRPNLTKSPNPLIPLHIMIQASSFPTCRWNLKVKIMTHLEALFLCTSFPPDYTHSSASLQNNGLQSRFNDPIWRNQHSYSYFKS